MRGEPNSYVGVNYLDLNSKMAVPPAYWLARLFDFDNMLVVFPSFAMPYAYVLARRRQRTAGLTDRALEATLTHPDTRACMANGLVPVSMIYRTGESWQIDPILRSLKARDIWEHGGADKMADEYDAADDAEKKRKKDAVRDDMWNRSGDAWRSYQARTGQRSKLTVPSPGAALAPSSSTLVSAGRDEQAR